jgi:acyl carrier protein
VNPPALTTLLADILGVPAATLGDATAMADVETWDSLRHIELVVRLEESCGIQLGPDDIVEMVTIGAIRAVLARHGATIA